MHCSQPRATGEGIEADRPYKWVVIGESNSSTVVSMDRWSQSDKNVYGAEDDDDMDAIMRALDQAMADETEALKPPASD